MNNSNEYANKLYDNKKYKDKIDIIEQEIINSNEKSFGGNL